MASILKTDKIEGVTASGTVQMPAGHVIQYQRSRTNSDLGTVTSTSYVKLSSSLDVTITPKFATSTLIIHASAHVYVNTNAYPSCFFAFSVMCFCSSLL